MNKDLVLISHGIGKKEAPVKAQVSLISSIGEFVTTYYTPTKRPSTRNKFKNGLLKCFGKSENSPRGFNDTDWTIQFIENERNDREVSTHERDNNYDHIASTIIVASDEDPLEKKSNLFNNSHHTIAFEIPFDPSLSACGPKKYLEGPCNGKDQLEKQHFRVWLNKEDQSFDCLKAKLPSKEILTEIAERAAKMALVRSRSKAALRAGAVITAAHARMNNSRYCMRIFNNNTATGLINQACRERLSISPTPNDKDGDHDKFLQLSYYEFDSIQPENYELHGLPRSENESERSTNHSTSSKAKYPSMPENIEKKTSTTCHYPGRDDLESRSLLESSELNGFDDEQCPFSAGTRNWLQLLMSNTDSLGKSLDTGQALGDEFNDNSIDIDDNNQMGHDELETSSSKTRGLGLGANPCMLDDSWIEIFLSQINEDSSHSFHEQSDEIKSVMTVRDFRIYLDNISRDRKSCSGSKSGVEDKVAVNRSNDRRNILGSLSSEGTDSQDDINSSQEDISCCTDFDDFMDFDDYLMDFSKAYLRIEALDSQFKQISCQVDKIIFGILGHDIDDELSSETHQNVSELEWDGEPKYENDSLCLRPNVQV